MRTTGPSRHLADMWVPEEVRGGVEAIALPDPVWASSLAYNPWLTEPTWHALYDRYGSKLEVAKALVSRTLTAAQLDRVVVSERRMSVLAAAFADNPVTDPSHLVVLADRELGRNAARALIGHLRGVRVTDPVLPSTLRLAAAAGAAAYVGMVADNVDRVDDTVCRDAVLAAAAEERLRSDARHDVLRILTARPHLVDGLVGVSVSLDMTLAGSSLIGDPARQWRIAGVADADIDRFTERRFVLLALIANPGCDRAVAVRIDKQLLAVHGVETSDVRTDVHFAVRRRGRPNRPTVTDLASVADGAVLTWLVSRAVADQNGRGPRPFETAALAANPHLEPWMADLLSDAVTDPEVVRCVGAGEARRLFDLLTPRCTQPRTFPDRTRSPWTSAPPEPSAYERHQVLDDDLSKVTVATLHRSADVLARTLRIAYLRFGDDPAAHETLRNLIGTFDLDAPVGELLDLVTVL